MIIKLSPDANFSYDLVVHKFGDVIVINGESFDFTPLSPGDTLPQAAINSLWFRGDVDRTVDGEVVVTIALPNGPNATYEQRFPEPLVNVPDGLVVLPQGPQETHNE